MPDLTVSSAIDVFLSSADQAGARANLGLGTTDSPMFAGARFSTATTADALSDVLLSPSAATQRGLTIQGKPAQTAPLLRIVESSNNTANSGWEFSSTELLFANSGNRCYLNANTFIGIPTFSVKWSSSTSNPFAAATLGFAPTSAGSGILEINNGTLGGVGNLALNGTGHLILPKTITAPATTGAQTINKTSGRVNFAAAATSLVVTNTICTVNSIIIGSIATNDSTANGLRVVAGPGSFTIHMLTAPTAETAVNFLLTN